MEDFYIGYPHEYKILGRRQDRIGWCRYMEGMIVADLRMLQTWYAQQQECRNNGDQWARKLVTKLLECTHGQWLYRNVVVYDRNSGTEQVARKEEIQVEFSGSSRWVARH